MTLLFYGIEAVDPEGSSTSRRTRVLFDTAAATLVGEPVVEEHDRQETVERYVESVGCVRETARNRARND